MAVKFYLTSAIPYVNGLPHLGHSLEYVITDVIKRYHQLIGDEVLLTAGSDENGQKILEAAKQEGLKPQELADRNTQAFLKHTKNLNVEFDVWRRASDQKLHWPGVNKIWELCYKNGDIYKKKYQGLYCVGCEQFYAKSELKGNKCPEHLVEPELVEEENYFFKLSKYQKQLEKLIKTDGLRVLPEIRKNETLGFIKQGLKDFSISRPKERLDGWGIPVPGDASQVMYVWFDALTIYMTAVGWGYDNKLWKKWWPADLHVIGKGIYRFHTVYWPAMLLSAKLPLPKTVLIHGYVTSGGQKMAKSLGNVIDPEAILKKYGTDAVRYYLLKEVPTQSDGDFTEARFKEVYNAELANGLGNLVARIETLVNKNGLDLSKIKTRRKKKEALAKLKKYFDEYRFDQALEYVWGWIRGLDHWLDREKPWKLTKNEARKKLGEIIEGTEAVSSIREVGWALEPFLPTTALEIEKRFSKKIAKTGKSLFPRLE
jgi:methionyl-tRNA synthetase